MCIRDRYKASEELRNRYYVYASGKYPVGNFVLSLRERFQSTYKTGAEHPKNYLRTMLTLSYKICKTDFSPFAYAEIFNDTGYQGNMHTDRIRLSAGSDYKINKQNALQLYYRYHIFNVYDPVNYKHAICLLYTSDIHSLPLHFGETAIDGACRMDSQCLVVEQVRGTADQLQAVHKGKAGLTGRQVECQHGSRIFSELDSAQFIIRIIFQAGVIDRHNTFQRRCV